MFKNTLQEASFRMMIYKSRTSFVGVCYETGLVEIWPTMEETRKHLHDGTVALLKAAAQGDVSEKVLNRKPAFKYRILFLVLPMLKGLSGLLSVTLFTEPLTPLAFRHS